MTDTLTMLHTAESNRGMFGALMAEYAPDIPVEHIVDEAALREACACGIVTPPIRRRVCDTLLGALDRGARAVLCTCSSIGGAAELAAQLTERPILRVDRPMAREAVARSERIVVAATLTTTLEPTRDLILREAEAAGRSVTIRELLCDRAWERLEAGDQEGYLNEIAAQLSRADALGDLLVLAQASMARAIDRCPGLALPVLTSPRSGLLAAIEAYRAAPPVAA
jgi:hypothetical protein